MIYIFIQKWLHKCKYFHLCLVHTFSIQQAIGQIEADKRNEDETLLLIVLMKLSQRIEGCNQWLSEMYSNYLVRKKLDVREKSAVNSKVETIRNKEVFQCTDGGEEKNV